MDAQELRDKFAAEFEQLKQLNQKMQTRLIFVEGALAALTQVLTPAVEVEKDVTNG